MPLDPKVQADLDHRFAHHPPRTPDRVAGHETIRQIVRTTVGLLVEQTPAGREQAVMITKLEEAMFWANAALARAKQDG